jgi:hypothetical protein
MSCAALLGQFRDILMIASAAKVAAMTTDSDVLEGVWKQASKRFFFEKKKQKTFASCGLWLGRCHFPQEIRVFLLLFLQKKKRFL